MKFIFLKIFSGLALATVIALCGILVGASGASGTLLR
jgi:hypothetical protein